jgi:hypothetical protein
MQNYSPTAPGVRSPPTILLWVLSPVSPPGKSETVNPGSSPRLIARGREGLTTCYRDFLSIAVLNAITPMSIREVGKMKFVYDVLGVTGRFPPEATGFVKQQACYRITDENNDFIGSTSVSPPTAILQKMHSRMSHMRR